MDTAAQGSLQHHSECLGKGDEQKQHYDLLDMGSHAYGMIKGTGSTHDD
jgi:hypothetical protein